MRTSLAPILAAAFAAATTFGLASPANAAVLDSCGNVELSANANCEMRVSGGCTASCEPVNFRVQCAADLYVGCNGMCNAQVDAQCTADCQGGCEAECQVDPAKFDCAASCRADCGATCQGSCAGQADSARCESSCEATCGGECDARCDVTPPSADCQAQCQACCTGSCDAEANMDCQINCQADGFVNCETQLQGGCQTACERPDGALFCDGQYVDVGEQLDACVAQLQSLLEIKVTGYAYADGSCEGTSCSASAKAGCSCSTVGGSEDDGPANALGMLGALAAFGLAFGRRKK